MASPAFQPAQATGMERQNNGAAGNHHAARAIRAYARKATQENLSLCCGHAESLIRALAGQRMLPKAFALPKSVRESVNFMGEETRFALLAGLADGQNGVPKPTIYPIVVAASIGRRLYVTRQDEIVHGKTVGDWVDVVRRVLEGAARSVEHFYGRKS